MNKKQMMAEQRVRNNPEASPVFDEFLSVFDGVISRVDVSHIPPKYLVNNYMRKFITLYNLLRHIIETEAGKDGIDIGCGLGHLCVLGKILQVNVVGVEIDEYDFDEEKTDPQEIFRNYSVTTTKFSLPFLPVLQELSRLGYNIDVFNTNEFPWERYRDNEFDFVNGCWALLKNFVMKGMTDEELDEIKDLKIKELIRITKPNGIWYICPPTHIAGIQENQNFIDNTKNIKIVSYSDIPVILR